MYIYIYIFSTYKLQLRLKYIVYILFRLLKHGFVHNCNMTDVSFECVFNICQHPLLVKRVLYKQQYDVLRV